jgi:hypothetical protein
MRRPRLTTLLARMLLTAVVVTSCTASRSVFLPALPAPLLSFHGGGISFRYPATWMANRYNYVSSFTTAIVYLSNDPLHPPCHGGSCGAPISQLDPDGVLLTWTENGSPSWTCQQAKGTAISVGGHRATIQIDHPGTCGRIGGDESISIVVENPSLPDNWWRIDACIRGPDMATAEEQLQSMLRTVQFSSD